MDNYKIRKTWRAASPADATENKGGKMEERIVVNIEFMQCRSIFSAIYRIQRLLEAQHAAPLLSQGLYNLKHMEQLEHLSFKGQKALFVRLEELARIANMNKKERAEYEAALKIYRDNENVVTTARREGKEEGIAIGEERGVLKTARLMKQNGASVGFIKTARLMKQNGASVGFIKQCTGMTEEEIKNL